mgnify:FL=1|jgi:hypothetical protein
MKVGDLVTAPHWGSGYIGLVVEVRLRAGWSSGICSVMMNDGTVIDQLVKDLEIINKKT